MLKVDGGSIMKTDDFNYELPLELIAQTPLKNRSESKLLVVDRISGDLSHQNFYDIVDLIEENSVLVLNDTKVIPARLFGSKESTNARIELLLLKDLGNNIYECLARPAKRLQVHTIISFGDGRLKAEVLSKLEDGIVHVKFIYEGIFLEILDSLGEMPLPPYIHEKLEDKDRYQTVYAKHVGSAAAPTAGLHFTNELLKKLKDKGITICYLTLHVGLGTFRPVEVEDVKKHKMHEEYYELSESVADILNQAKLDGKKIVAVGTTTTRVLETVFNKYKEFKAISGKTDIFIYPGYEFKAIDCLITNFHLPKSTLLMLVSAFSSKKIIMKAYSEAVKKQYRFFSFGDAMYLYKK